MYVRKPNKVHGGVGGIGKSARSFLREIMSDKDTFESVFNTDNGKFVIARKGGKKQIKTGLYKQALQNTRTNRIICNCFKFLSDM